MEGVGRSYGLQLPTRATRGGPPPVSLAPAGTWPGQLGSELASDCGYWFAHTVASPTIIDGRQMNKRVWMPLGLGTQHDPEYSISRAVMEKE